MKIGVVCVLILLLSVDLQAQSADTQDVYLYVGPETDWNAMSEAWESRRLPLEQRALQVRRQLPLQRQAKLNLLELHLKQVPGVRDIHRYWIAPVIRANVPVDAIESLRLSPLVASIHPVPAVVPDDVSLASASLPVPGGREAAHDVVGAPALWQQGYTGYGRKVYIIDSGVDPAHPALGNQFAGNFSSTDQAWYEPGGSTTPRDCGNHGTLVAGVILGLNRSKNDTTGIAPEAIWMASPPASNGGACANVDILSALEWALDPDSDSTTVADIPDVINNSWSIDLGNPSAECAGPYRDALAALEAAGIAVVFSAGNTGPSDGSIPSPKNLNINPVNVFCVGSINGNNPSYMIANSSSRGPSSCVGLQDTIKPEVVAPGVQVRTTGLGGAYFNVSGTSFAAPHAAGAALLLKDAYPNASGKKILEALYYSALDLGDPGPDNSYGNGLMNLPAAFLWLQNQGFLPRVPNDSNNIAISSFFTGDSITCDSMVYPLLSLSNPGPNVIQTLTAVLERNGNTDTLIWTGNLAPGGNAFWGLPGDTIATGLSHFVVTIVQVNGQEDQQYLDNRARAQVTRLPLSAPLITLPEVCKGAEILADAGNGDVAWYGSASANEPELIGSPVLIGPFSTDSSVFVAQRERLVAGKSNNQDEGNYQTDFSYLIFDAEVPFVLESVTVYSQGDGNRRIVLRQSDGIVLHDTTMFLNFGKRILTLDMEVPAGTSLELGVESQFVRLLTTTEDVQFPYEVPGVLSITGSDLGQQVYAYFYDWEIVYEGCRRQIPVLVSTSPKTISILPEDSTVYLAAGGMMQWDAQPSGWSQASWNYGDGTSGTGAVGTHVYDSAGRYSVFVTGQYLSGCSASAGAEVRVVDWALGSLDPSDWGLDLFPNPTKGKIMLTWSWLPGEELALEVWDVAGKMLRKEWIRPMGGSWELDIQDMAPGSYFLRCQSGGQESVKRVQIIP